HDLSLLVELADTIAVMYAGRIVEHAGAQDLYQSPRHPYSVGLANSFPPLHGERRRLHGIPGSPPDLHNLPTGCAFHPRCPMADDHCREAEPALLPVPVIGPGWHHPRYAACWRQLDPVVPPALARPEPDTTPGPRQNATDRSAR
ncbi:MAG: ABC transporter ATP-binding protein, partial [Acidimicrobiaceae bacterium]|nr:ABC transporter ATP-binding protein [Acidimicrobiaceae bacterium]